MAKLQSTFTNMVLSLTLITLVAAGALAGVYMLTAQPIAEAQKAKQEQALKAVLPEYETLADADTINGLTIRKAYAADSLVGAAVETTSDGFGGKLKIMVGFDAQGSIVNYEVLEQSETPGLGTHIVEWFKNPAKDGQNIIGSNPGTRNFTVSKDGGEVDAITAATISSRAFLMAIQAAYDAYMNKPQACTGATQLSQQPEACIGASKLCPQTEEQVIEGAETIIETVEQITVESNE